MERNIELSGNQQENDTLTELRFELKLKLSQTNDGGPMTFERNVSCVCVCMYGCVSAAYTEGARLRALEPITYS